MTQIEAVKYPANLDFRSKIDALEEQMKGMKTIPIEDLPVRHHFGGGMYAREMFLAAGTIVTGRIKKHEHISVISLGEVYEGTENSKRHIKAPFTMVSAPGTKRLVVAVTDTVWTTIHKTDKTDLDELDKELIAETHAELENIT